MEKTGNFGFRDLTAKIGEVGKCGRRPVANLVLLGLGGPDGMYLRAILICCPGSIGRQKSILKILYVIF